MAWYFAWVDEGTAYNAGVHQVEDEEVFAFEIRHEEGQFPICRVEILNPRVGFLNPGRKQWAWLSDDTGALFYGRLVGVPADLQENVVAIELTARPADFEAQKAALADTMRVLPDYDPVWVSPDRRSDPDSVLEAIPKLWHIDRLTHVVTASSIVAGEDGTLALGPGALFEDSLDLAPAQPPVRKINVEAEVYWDQVATGTVDLWATIRNAFGGQVESYTGEGLLRDWPKRGDRIGSGWSVAATRLRPREGSTVVEQEIFVDIGATAAFPLWEFDGAFSGRYDARRARTERLTFTMIADVQALYTDAGDEEELFLTLSSGDIGLPIDDGGLRPIRSLKRRAYFPTARGQQSIQYLLNLCRARILARARAVSATGACAFDTARGLSCRWSASFTDDRIPGGEISGKVVAYTLFARDGEVGATVTIAGMVGNGGSYTAAAGTPSWAEADYIGADYQVFAGAEVAIEGGGFSATWPAPDDDGVDFDQMTPARVVQSCTVANTAEEQRDVLRFPPDYAVNWPSLSAAASALNAAYTTVTLSLVPLQTGPFQTDYTITVTPLIVPKTIDLEAASS